MLRLMTSVRHQKILLLLMSYQVIQILQKFHALSMSLWFIWYVIDENHKVIHKEELDFGYPAMIHSFDGVPRGELRIASTVAFGKSQLIPALPEFMKENPEVEMSLNLTDREIDLRSEGFDAAICFAEQRKNPDMVIRRVMQSRRVLCASPEYLERCGTPSNFADLVDHNCLRVAGRSQRNSWNSILKNSGAK